MNIKAIVIIDERILLMEKAKRDMINQFVAEHHPHKVGNEVACNDLGHPGKTMEVTQSYMDLHRQPGGVIYAYCFRCKGRIINKTESAGSRVGEWMGHVIPLKSLEPGIAKDDNGE